ncbi:MAG: hypothetical protein M5U09_13595 [Gammaproteobacteria bacterium]|nr:hypothetical protein [Gammaproteobacteria bacterium]
MLNEQDMFLWAAKKYSVCYWLGRAQDAAEALGETEIPVGDPEEIRLMVPPYTRLARVMVLAQDADPDDFTYYQRVEVSGAADPETYRHRQEALSNGQTSLDQAVWWSSDAREPSADDLP